jgi:hypothetical protein
MNARCTSGSCSTEMSDYNLNSLVEMELNSKGGQLSTYKELDKYHQSSPTHA